MNLVICLQRNKDVTLFVCKLTFRISKYATQKYYIGDMGTICTQKKLRKSLTLQNKQKTLIGALWRREFSLVWCLLLPFDLSLYFNANGKSFFKSHELKCTPYTDSQRKEYSRTEVDFMEFKVDKWCVTERDFQLPFLKHQQHNSFSLLCLKLESALQISF